MNQFYEQAGSLFVEAYDAFYSSSGPNIAGDPAFYERVARDAGGPVLELACGTGRVALPLAKAGLHVTGVDRSEAMLKIARCKLAAYPASVQARTELSRSGHERAEFGPALWLCLCALSFRSASVDDRSAKKIVGGFAAIWSRLAVGPSLVRSSPRLADPHRTYALPGLSGTHPETGRRYWVRFFEPISSTSTKIRRDLWRYAEIGPNGEMLAEELARWPCVGPIAGSCIICSSLCGLAVEAEYSDFVGSAPAYGKELILVARAA